VTQTLHRRIDPVNELGNEFTDTSNGREASVEVASTRAAQEVQAMLVIAKRFPRNETAAYEKIMQACKRRSLAESAQYAYPRGGETVEGPSIRLAEAMARAWGNLDFGIVELEQRNGESSIMAYAWDLETNARQTKVFTVRHLRYTRAKGNTALNDPRDIYEISANQGARRLRACILGIIPGDITEAAVAQCEKTMAGSNGEPLADRVRKMLSVFEELGVNQEMIERRLAKRLDATTETELAKLRKIFRSLKDNMASVEDFFPSQQQHSAATADLNAKIQPKDSVAPVKEVKQEPAVSGADAAEPQPEPQTKEMSPREKWLAEMDELREASGIADKGRFFTTVQTWAIKVGCKGREHEAPQEKIDGLVKAVAEKIGIFEWAKAGPA
jgi:hypothetical protein